MNLRFWLLVVLLLSGGCSLHSLEYLEQHGDSVTAAGFSGMAGAGPLAAAGGGMSTVAGAGGTPAVAAAGMPGVSAAAGTAGGAVPEARCAEDDQVNGDETDIDCGGRSCVPCQADKRCVTGSDCASAICTNQVCQPPSCADLARNGDETDLNCGGSCAPCSNGHACLVGADCKTGQCLSAICVTPNCDGPNPDAGCPPLADDTPYSLRPASAPASCIDGVALGVDNGVAMQQYACHGGANQTFWAIPAPGGYFALRSALSGKCLQVRANSLDSGAVIEQDSCTGQGDQLFLPSAGSKGLKLVIQSSGLSLDVAGAASPGNGQLIVQSADDGSTDMRWTAVKTASDGYMTLSALGQTGVFLRHVGNVVRAEASLGPDSHWKVEPGLASPSCVSFQSVDQPGAYLRHTDSLMWCDTSDGSLQFSKDATFCFRPPLSGSDLTYRSLQSFNYSTNYVSASDGRGRLLTFQETPQFRQLATWVVGPHG